MKSASVRPSKPDCCSAELQARRPLRSVLVVCSRTLVVEEKWHREMRPFDEEFVTLSSTDLRHCLDQTDLDGEWPERYARAILPYSLVNENLLHGYPTRRGAARSKGLATLDTPPRFDLLIVDEAHNARNTDTNLYQGLRLHHQTAGADHDKHCVHKPEGHRLQHLMLP
jgi:ATP-dependent helicase HepA